MTIVIILVYAIWVLLLYKSVKKIANGIFLMLSIISIVLLLEDDYLGIMVMLPL